MGHLRSRHFQPDLPAYVAIPDPRGKPQNSVNNWGSGFLPAAFQGTAFNAASPIRNLARPDRIQPGSDQATRDFLSRLNERHLEQFPGDTELAARIASYELAARMQLSVPEVADLANEPAHVLRLYGADDKGSKVKDIRAAYARNCILARRLLERGVRFVNCSTAPTKPAAKASATGTDTRTSSTNTAFTDRSWTSPPPDCSSTSNSVGCSGHAGRLVHRVRSHADVPKGRAGPGPQSARIHLLAGGRRV
jgi:hypothetical protein